MFKLFQKKEDITGVFKDRYKDTLALYKSDLDRIFGYNYLSLKDTVMCEDEFLFILSYICFFGNFRMNESSLTLDFINEKKEPFREYWDIYKVFSQAESDKKERVFRFSDKYLETLFQYLDFPNKDYYVNELCLLRIDQAFIITKGSMFRDERIVFIKNYDIYFKQLNCKGSHLLTILFDDEKDIKISQLLLKEMGVTLPYLSNSLTDARGYLYQDNYQAEPVSLIEALTNHSYVSKVLKNTLNYQFAVRNPTNESNIHSLASDFLNDFTNALANYKVNPESILPILYALGDSAYFEKVYQVVHTFTQNEYMSLPLEKQEELKKRYLDKILLTDIQKRQQTNEQLIENVLNDLIN